MWTERPHSLRFFTLLSVAFLIVSFAQLGFPQLFTKKWTAWHFLFCEFIFFGGIHSGLTFVNAFFLKETQAWRQAYNRTRTVSFEARTAVLFVCLLAYGLMAYFLGRSAKYMVFVAICVVLLRGVVLASHVVLQQRSLYLMNRNFSPSEIQSYRKWIHAFVPVAIINHTIFFSSFNIQLREWSLVAESFFLPEMTFVYGAFILLALTFRLWQDRRLTSQIPLLLTFCLWLLCSRSTLANFSVFAIHGLEYFSVFLAVSGRQNSFPRTTVWAIGAIAILCVGSLLVWSPTLRPIFDATDSLTAWQKVLLAAQIGIAILHVHLDSLIYRRPSDPHTPSLWALLYSTPVLHCQTSATAPKLREMGESYVI